MKTKLLFLLSFFLLVGNCFGQVMFQKVITAQNTIEATSVQQTTDQGYIIAGYTLDSAANYQNVYLAKTNKEGTISWTKSFGGISGASGSSVAQTKDGGYIVAGTINNSDSTGYCYVIKTDENGDTIWTKAYGGFGEEGASSIKQTNEGGYILTGTTKSFGAGDADIYLIKINNTGDITWTKTYGGSYDDHGLDVKQTLDSGYIIAGIINSFNGGYGDVYLIKTKANGDTLWTKAYGGAESDNGYSVQETTDSGYIVTGNTYSFGAGNDDVYLIKTKANGDTIWTKTYGRTGYDISNEVEQTRDGGYILVGFSSSFAGEFGNAYLIKTDSNGDTLWTKTYGGSYWDVATSVHQTNDSGYIITGSSQSFITLNNGIEIYLIKTDANGNSGCNENITNTIVGYAPFKVGSTNTIVGTGGTASYTSTIIGSGGNDSILCLATGLPEQTINNTIYIYPNPAGSELRIKNAELRMNKPTVYIVNMLGQTVLQYSIFNLQSSINVSSLPSGIYFVRVADEKESWVGKFVKE